MRKIMGSGSDSKHIHYAHSDPSQNRTGALSDPCAVTCKEIMEPVQGPEEDLGQMEDGAPTKGLPPWMKKGQGVNLYPTPRMEWKCFGDRGSSSKYFRKATMKLSTVRVVGNTL